MTQSYAEVLEGESEVWASTERSARNPPPGWDFLIWADCLRFESSQVSEIAMLLMIPFASGDPAFPLRVKCMLLKHDPPSS